MTPPPAASATVRRAPAQPRRPRAATRAPRRASGVARPAARIGAGGLLTSGGALALPRLDPRALTRRLRLGSLVGGRIWIGLFAAMLLGLVFLQVSLLKLNTAISQNVARAQTLDRSNSGLRGSLARLSAGQRIQDVAGQFGMVMPGAGSVCYLRAATPGPCSGGDAAAATTASDPLQTTAPPPPNGSVAIAPAQSAGATSAAPGAPTTTAPTTTAPTTTSPVSTTPAGTAPAPVAQAPVTQPAAGQVAPTQTQAPVSSTPTAAPATTGGGVSAPAATPGG